MATSSCEFTVPYYIAEFTLPFDSLTPSVLLRRKTAQTATFLATTVHVHVSNELRATMSEPRGVSIADCVGGSGQAHYFICHPNASTATFAHLSPLPLRCHSAAGGYDRILTFGQRRRTKLSSQMLLISNLHSFLTLAESVSPLLMLAPSALPCISPAPSPSPFYDPHTSQDIPPFSPAPRHLSHKGRGSPYPAHPSTPVPTS